MRCDVVTNAQLAPIDLLFTADKLVELLRQAIRDREWLDAYLLIAGLNQMVEDRLHPDPFQLSQAADFLQARGVRAARIAGALSEWTARVVGPMAVGRQVRSLWRLRDSLTKAAIRLGSIVLDPRNDAPVLPAGLDAALSAARRLDADVLCVPSCFRSFDQHPDDCAELVRRFLENTDTSKPVCVVGVRTSGSYLAPLCAAALEAHGVAAVSVLTYRPGRSWRRAEAKLARGIVAAGGTFLVTDDPPVTGTTLAKTGRAIESLGIPRCAITFLLALAGTETRTPLNRYSGVFLPWSQWSVHTRMSDAAVGATLTGLLGPGHMVTARRRPLAHADRRGHVRARFAVDVTTDSGMTHREIAVEGAGLGYLGRQAVAVAAELQGHVPRVYGHVDGLLYRDWVPGLDTEPDEHELVDAIARYVEDRSRALRVDTDPTSRLRHRLPVWEVTGKLLSALFGQLAPVGQTLLLERIMLNLTRTETACVTDGGTQVRHWLAASPTSPVRKVSFHEWSFSNHELVCYDPIFDLACAAADPPSDDFESLIRGAYEWRTGQAIDPERWLLYRIAQLARLGRIGELNLDHVMDRSADALHDYLSTVFGRVGSSEAIGYRPICGIDLDGVLETTSLGFPCTTPIGALSLKALTAHGFQPVLVTGRSLPDTIARCRRFDLAGAVAEYGAVLYDHRTARSTDLRDNDAQQTMQQVRRVLDERVDIEVDQRHRYIVRARSAHGPIAAGLAEAVESSTNSALRIVVGDGQTDFVPSNVDKGTGLRALADLLGRPVAMAVGDSTEDLAMFAEAGVARAPHNADAAVRAARIRLTRRSYQSGLAEACADLLGHRPGDCSQCRQSQLPARTVVLCAVLGLREDGLRGLASRTARLIALAATGGFLRPRNQ